MTFRTRLEVIPTYDQEQIILGSLLGDGTLGNPRRCGTIINSHLRLSHTIKQKEYLEWKHGMLSPFAYPIHSMIVKDSRGGHWKPEREVQYFNCASHSYFSGLHRLWYPEDKKVFSLKNVKRLDWLGLAVWYMDDGTYGHNKGTYGFLCTEGFGIEAQKDIQLFITRNFGLPCTIVSTGHGLKKIRLGAAAIRIMQEKLSSYIIPSMQYKLGCQGSSSYNISV